MSGVNIDADLIREGADFRYEKGKSLSDMALVTAADFTPQAWTILPDPFPRWGEQARS